jgi:hypothetical protein
LRRKRAKEPELQDARTFPRCPTTDKVQYPSEELALRYAARLILKGKAIWLRAYLCLDCGSPHLSKSATVLNGLIAAEEAAARAAVGEASA